MDSRRLPAGHAASPSLEQHPGVLALLRSLPPHRRWEAWSAARRGRARRLPPQQRRLAGRAAPAWRSRAATPPQRWLPHSRPEKRVWAVPTQGVLQQLQPGSSSKPGGPGRGRTKGARSRQTDAALTCRLTKQCGADPASYALARAPTGVRAGHSPPPHTHAGLHLRQQLSLPPLVLAAQLLQALGRRLHGLVQELHAVLLHLQLLVPRLQLLAHLRGGFPGSQACSGLTNDTTPAAACAPAGRLPGQATGRGGWFVDMGHPG